MANVLNVKPIQALVIFDGKESSLITMLTKSVFRAETLPQLVEATEVYISEGNGLDNGERLLLGRALVRYMAAKWQHRGEFLTDRDMIGLSDQQQQEIWIQWGTPDADWRNKGLLEAFERITAA